MRTTALSLAMLLMLPGAARAASDAFPPNLEAAALRAALLCKDKKATPNRVATLVNVLGGHGTVKSADHSAFTLPDALDVLGEPVHAFTVTRRWNDDGEFFEYAVPLAGEPLEVIASRADTAPDAVGDYRRWIGSNELLIRTEGGVAVLTCAPHVNSVFKRVKRFFRTTFARGA